LTLAQDLKMRFPNLALFAISAVPLSVLASPVAQFSPPAEDSLTTTTDEQWFPMPTMVSCTFLLLVVVTLGRRT
jgi:hypothetical protein